ncbi:MAG: ATP synthase F1 subunit delta [Clostridia bacterium]|nr:ATP synthase F1 subunit delta [Clostridia bacterium]
MTEIANVYGQALYDLAKDEGLTDEVLDQITVLDVSFSQEPQFLQLLCAPSVPKEERCQILDDSFRGQVHPYVLNFLKILTEKGYMRHFSNCCQLFLQQYNKDNGILPVKAVTPLPLSDEQRRRLVNKLSEVTGKTVSLQCRVDPECLGGVRLELDGIQVDGTVRHRLNEMHKLLRNTVL